MSLRLPTSEYKLLTVYVLQRDHWKCRSCQFRAGLHAHHIVFRSHQGPDTSANLVVLCSACHDGIHVHCKDGLFGLVILWDGDAPNADAPDGIRFQRNWQWKPQ